MRVVKVVPAMSVGSEEGKVDKPRGINRFWKTNDVKVQRQS